MTQVYRKRLTAMKLPISELCAGKMIQQESGELFDTRLGGVKRVRILGLVVQNYHSQKEGKKPFTLLTIDDGTGQITLKAWGREAIALEKHNRGDSLDIIGIIRMDREEPRKEPYIVPELVIPIYELTWELIRRLEIVQQYQEAKITPPAFQTERGDVPETDMFGTPQIPHTPTTPTPAKEEPAIDEKELEIVKDRLVELIKKLDQGQGAGYKTIISTINHELAEEALLDLLHNGVAYEPSPAKYKILD